MLPASMQLLFDSGGASVRMKVVTPAQLDAAVRCMLAERDPRYAHRLRLEPPAGGNVTIRPRGR